MMRTLVYVGLGGMLAAACTPAAPSPRGATAVAIAPMDTSAAISTASQVNARCKLTTEDWGNQGEGQLRFAPDEPPFVFFGGGRVWMTLGSPVPGIETRVDERGVVLEGVSVPADVGLYALRPLLFGEVAMPFGDTILHWTGRTDDAALMVVHHISVAGGGHVALKGSVTCADITLDPQEYEPNDGHNEGPMDEERFLVVTSVAVAPTPRGPTVATLGVDQATDRVTVIEREGTRVRVVWPRAREVVRGWIDAAVLRKEPAREDLEEDFGAGGLGLSGVGGATIWKCPRKLTLFAKRGERIREVGHIVANAEVSMGVVNDGYRDVSLYVTRNLRAAKDVTFFVRNADLVDCS